MITATEALSMSIKFHEMCLAEKSPLDKVMEAIVQAASAGQRSLMIADEIDEEDLSMLGANGFEVERPSGIKIIIIRW